MSTYPSVLFLSHGTCRRESRWIVLLRTGRATRWAAFRSALFIHLFPFIEPAYFSRFVLLGGVGGMGSSISNDSTSQGLQPTDGVYVHFNCGSLGWGCFDVIRGQSFAPWVR